LCVRLTPELTGAGGPIGPQGTNIGHKDGEAMANVGVRVERFVRLGANAATVCVADNLIWQHRHILSLCL